MLFYEKYPSPSKLQGVTVEELAELLEENSNKKLGRDKAAQILDLVKNDGDTSTEYQEARDQAIRSTIRQIHHNNQEIETIDGILEEFLEYFDYHLTSMKGIETVIAAKLIAEIGDISKFPTPGKLARYAGVAPVTYSSGMTNVQYANQRGNRVLNSVFYHLAVLVSSNVGKNKTIINPFFYEYYHKKISEGKTKGQALKCVQRRLVNIIWNMMTYKTEYINPPKMSPKQLEKTAGKTVSKTK